MKVPIEISYRGVLKSEEIEALIRERAKKLEQFCSYLSSCRVAVEKTQLHQRIGSPYRVRVDLTVPPGHELVSRREQSRGSVHDELATEIRETFDAAERQLKELVERQRGELKKHPRQQVDAIVSKLFREDGYGFLLTGEGREIYFQRGSVLNGEFDNLAVGTGVNFTERAGEKGPHASTVRVVGRGDRTG